MRMLVDSRGGRRVEARRDGAESIYRRDSGQRTRSFLFEFDLPVEGNVWRVPGYSVLIRILRVVLLRGEVDEERGVGAYGLVTMSHADRYAKDDVVARAEVMGLGLALRRRAFAHVVKPDFADTLDHHEVVFLLLVIMPGADDARVVERIVALAELREDLVRPAKELHEVATLIDVRLELLDLHSFDHVAAFPKGYGVASARRFPYCCS